jgi:hypothetical protein
MALGLLMAIAALAIAVAAAADQAVPRVLQLYLDPSSGAAQRPIVTASNQGLGSLRCQAAVTLLEDGASRTRVWPEFVIGDGERWRGEVPAAASGPAGPVRVDVELSCHRGRQPLLERSLRIWLDGS